MPGHLYEFYLEVFNSISDGERAHHEISNICEDEMMMFRSYSNTSENFVRDYVAKAMVIMLFSHVNKLN